MGTFLDIFRMDASGAPLWLEAATDLHSARARVEALGAIHPGEYLIFDARTRGKILLRAPAHQSSGMSQSDMSAALFRVLDAAIKLVGTDLGNLQILDQGSKTLRIVAQYGFSEQFLEFFNNVKCKEGSCGTTLVHGRRVIVNDVTIDPIFYKRRSGQILLAEGVYAVQSVPLKTSSGRLMGVLSTHFRDAKPPRQKLLRISDAFATEIADLIERES